MTLRSETIGWVKFIRDAARVGRIGIEYVDAAIRFVTHDAVTFEPKTILKDVALAGRFTGAMKILICCLLMDLTGEFKESREFTKINTPDGIVTKKIARYLRGSSTMSTTSDIVKLMIKKLDGICRPGVMADLFTIMCHGYRNGRSNVFRFMDLKRAIFEVMSSPDFLEDVDRVNAINRYLLSLAAVGQDAASIYSWESKESAKNKCSFQSIDHPEFSLTQFFEDGPIAMFNGCGAMMFEIKFVFQTPCARTETPYVIIYDYGHLNNNEHWNRSRHYRNKESIIAYLLRLHKIPHKSVVETTSKLLLMFEDKLKTPAKVFTRSF